MSTHTTPSVPTYRSAATTDLRRTEATIGLGDDAPVLTRATWGGRPDQQWHPHLAVEHIRRHWRGPIDYIVTISGPVLTSKGNEHATQIAERSYGWDEVPEWLAPQLQGPDSLWDAITSAVLSAELPWKGATR